MKQKLKSNYDAILIPERTLELPQGKIYGLLYNQEFEKCASSPVEDYFTWLVGLEQWIRNGGTYENNADIWNHPDEIHSYSDNHAFRRVVLTLCKGLVVYKKLMFEKPIKIKKGETDRCWIVNPSLIERIDKNEQTEPVEPAEEKETH